LQDSSAQNRGGFRNQSEDTVKHTDVVRVLHGVQ